MKRQRYQPLVPKPYGFEDDPVAVAHTQPGTLHLPKVKLPKTPVKRTNEIAITVYVDGDVISFTAHCNLNDLIASQRNRSGFTALFRTILSSKFGRVEIT